MIDAVIFGVGVICVLSLPAMFPCATRSIPDDASMVLRGLRPVPAALQH